MYAWAVKYYNRLPLDRRSNLGRGENVRKLLGPSLFLVRFPCIEPAVIAKEIGKNNFFIIIFAFISNHKF
jgi:hypothetical protein